MNAKVTAFTTDKANYSHLSLGRPKDFAYFPGQYVTLAESNDAKPKFLALASHASEPDLLFVSRSSPVAVGTELIISAPMGTGFGSDFTGKKPFLFLTHGTGISAVRPAMVERRQLGFTGDTLLYGVRDAASEPELDCLRDSFGARQLRAFSEGRHWHVQDALAQMDLSSFGTVILVGSKEMAASCRETLAGKNFPSNRIFSNY